MIGVCTFIQKKKEDKNKKKQKKKKKKECKDMFVSHISLHRFFVVRFIIGGLSEIFMRDELRESSLRSFVPWIVTDMYLIYKKKKKKKECKDMFVSHILVHRFFVVGFIIGGLNEIFMRDELRESSLWSFVPWIMTDMYLI